MKTFFLFLNVEFVSKTKFSNIKSNRSETLEVFFWMAFEGPTMITFIKTYPRIYVDLCPSRLLQYLFFLQGILTNPSWVQWIHESYDYDQSIRNNIFLSPWIENHRNSIEFERNIENRGWKNDAIRMKRTQKMPILGGIYYAWNDT